MKISPDLMAVRPGLKQKVQTMKTLSEIRKEHKLTDEDNKFLVIADKLLDLMTLVRWAKASLSSAEVPCSCDDGGCLRCQTELVVEKHKSPNERMADIVREPVRGESIPF